MRDRCGCNDCREEGVIPVKVRVPDGRIGTIWVCPAHAEKLVQQLEEHEDSA
jgi:hypothetical protein